jgi:hypothetical protein
MNTIISCHLDSVFLSPMADVKNGVHTGCCDNLSGVLCCAQLINHPDIHIEYTNGEETDMEGAKWVADHYSSADNFIVVIDCTEKATRWKSIKFTVENPANVDLKHIKNALRNFRGKYKLKELGVESEAYLYKKEGFSCVEIDIPVTGGLHNLHNRAHVEDIITASEAVKSIVDYMKNKERSEIIPVEIGERR